MKDALLLPRRVEQAEAKVWPYRPKPIPGELVSSYIARIANGLGMQPITFLNSIMGSRKNLLAQDLDNFCPSNLVQRIAEGCDVEPEAITECTLPSFEGLLIHNLKKKGRNAWILPTTVDNCMRLRPGLQFCPRCLAEERPHFRMMWRLAFATICTKHGTLLLDRCPHCREPVHPLESIEAWRCHRCAMDMRTETPSAQMTTFHWQRRVERGLEVGWTDLGGEFVSSTVWFMIARQVAALLVNGPKAQAFRTTSASLYGGDDRAYPKPTRRQPIEYLEIDDRARLFNQVAELMHGWPHRFVEASASAGLCRSHAIKDMSYVPYAFEKMLGSYLDATPYRATDGEVAAAAAWLRRTKGAAYYRDLKHLCGESRMAIYRHMDYQRRQSKPSVWRARSGA